MFVEIALLLIAALFFYHRWSFNYWKKRNVFYIPGEPIFGNVKDYLLNKRSFKELLDEIYMKHKSKRIIGFYASYKPMLLVTDTELVKQVLVTDFNSFNDNGFCLDAKVDPMFGINPFCVKGLENWKAIRGIQVPMHSTFKLKEMVPQITIVGQHMTNYILKNRSKPIEVRELTGMYTIDTVTSCAYGFEPNAFINPENGFKKHASETLFDGKYINNVAADFFPFLGKLFSLRIVTKEAEDFFTTMMKRSFNFRIETKSYRNDLIDYLIKLNQKRKQDNLSEFTDSEIAGHCMTFYLDGYETCASALSFLLLEMSNSPEIQERLRQEIFQAGKNAEDFDFDKIQSLTYLGMVLNESLRKHPLLPVISRICTQDIVLGDVKVTKGTKVFIPAASLHKDPDLFPEPESFNPERFSEDNKDSIVKYSFIPFGEGPRICVGSKFAILQLKLAVITILLKFRVSSGIGAEKNGIEYDDAMAYTIVPKLGQGLRFDLL